MKKKTTKHPSQGNLDQTPNYEALYYPVVVIKMAWDLHKSKMEQNRDPSSEVTKLRPNDVSSKVTKNMLLKSDYLK